VDFVRGILGAEAWWEENAGEEKAAHDEVTRSHVPS
jgi:hypothetical protein